MVNELLNRSQNPMRFRNLILIGYLIAFPIVGWGAFRAIQTFGNNLPGWPNKNSQVRKNLEQFRNEFSESDFVMVAWPGGDLNDDRLARFEYQLSRPQNAELIKEIWSGRSFYESLRELGISHSASLKRMRGTMLGPADEQTLIVVNFTPYASKNRGALFDLLDHSMELAGIDPSQAKLAGPGYMLYEIDQESFWSPFRAIPWIILSSFVLTWMFFRHLQLAVVVLSTSVFMGLSSLAVVSIAGSHLNLLVWTMPSLVLLLTTSAMLHFMGYFRQLVDHPNPVRQALANAWRPILFCSLTTAIGLFSLMMSETAPVRDFGKFGGVSVLLSALVVLLVFPCWLSWIQITPRDLKISGQANRIWKYLAVFTFRFRSAIIAVGCVTLLVFGSALPKISTSVDIANFFPSQTRVMDDAAWFEANATPLSTIELTFRFVDADVDNDVDRMKFLQYLHRQFQKQEVIEGVLSPATFAPRWPKPARRSASSIIAQESVRNRVAAIKNELKSNGLVHASGSTEAWRMSIRVAKSQTTSPELLIEQLESLSRSKFDEVKNQRFVGESLELFSTGDAIVMNFVESQVLNDLIVTYSSAFVSISLVIFLILRSGTIAMLATPPNLFPAVLILGGIAAATVKLDVGSLITASVALGIAVDDTLHFVLWWRNRVAQGMSSQEAIVDSMKHCGSAMVQTTLVCGLSIALYGLCGFLPTVRFGLLLSGMLFAALIGDLLLLPALLSLPLASRIARRLPKPGFTE